jgi:hypothetical protein
MKPYEARNFYSAINVPKYGKSVCFSSKLISMETENTPQI